MGNKNSYEVVFQYEQDEDSKQKISAGRIKKSMEAHDGAFVSKFENYGMTDLVFNISANPDTVKTIMDTVLKDAQRADVKMSIFATREFDLVLFNMADVQNKDQMFDTLKESKDEISYRKVSVSPHNPNEVSIELNEDADKNEALKVSTSILKTLGAKNIALDVLSVEVMKIDNIKSKKSSLDY